MFFGVSSVCLLGAVIVSAIFVTALSFRLKKIATKRQRLPTLTVTTQSRHPCRFVSARRVLFQTNGGRWLSARVVQDNGKWLALRRHHTGPIFWGRLETN